METNLIDDRIERISKLITRLDEIPAELQEIDERLYAGFLTSAQFKRLIEKRSCLILERRAKKRKLREEYHILGEEESL